MKKVELLLLFIVNLFLVSCNADVFLDSESLHSNENASFPTTWQEQLRCAKNYNSSTARSAINGLALVRHSYNGKINTENQRSELLEQLFVDNADIVMYSDSLNFEIVSLKIIRQKAQSMGVDDPSKTLKLQLDSIIKVGMDILELEWCYKGKTYYSTAIASNEQGGILYDHIGHMIIMSGNHESRAREIKSDVKAIKTRSEGGGVTERSFVLQNDGGYNIWGNLVWEYTISCSSFFDGNGILCNRSMLALSDSAVGWSCDAKIETINGELGSSKFHEFAWGHAHAYVLSVSVEWNGVGFTISGGATGASGSIVHSR